jgi:hypothetical protein
MIEKDLQPEEIISTDRISNMPVLEAYFRVFQKGYRHILPRAIVVHHSELEKWHEYSLYFKPPGPSGKMGYFKPHKINALNALIERGAEYVLLDGNHSSTAEALCSPSISVIQISTKNDLREIREMAKTGEIRKFPHHEDNVPDMLGSFMLRSDVEFISLKDVIEECIEHSYFPDFMVEQYTQAAAPF